MTAREIDRFLERYTKALEEGDAAIFAGAGLSKPSGFVDWKELMREIAVDLGLEVDKETDLVALAQYHVNEYGGNRDRLNTLLIEEFTKDTSVTENHRLIANLPIHTIWTTNYDQLFEHAFHQVNKRVDVKTTKENLAYTFPKRDAVLYKMHGDISQPHDAVLTKEDYEIYLDKRSLFSELLKGDLISKTFLFLGFSFTDPNIDYILSRIRALLGHNQRRHYCIMRRIQKPVKGGTEQAQYEYDKTKLELRISDLKRYGIQALMIDDYSEITGILRELNERIIRRNIFVSGSARTYTPMDRGRIESLARDIGREIIHRGYNLVSGLGINIGSIVMIGAMEALYSSENNSLNDRVYLRPFVKRAMPELSSFEYNSKHRREMISNVGFTIFLCGDRYDEDSNQTVLSSGVLEEYELTKELGKYPIPVGATGHAARLIWEEVNNSLGSIYPQVRVEEYFKILGDETKSNEEIIDAIFAIVKRIAPQS
jgi:hypothetical protein